MKERFDLEGMGWRLDEERERRLVERITRSAEPELALRAERARRAFDGSRWLRPVLAAAAAVAALSLVTLERVERDGAAVAPTTADALELPSSVADWVARDRAPAMSEIMIAMSEGDD